MGRNIQLKAVLVLVGFHSPSSNMFHKSINGREEIGFNAVFNR